MADRTIPESQYNYHTPPLEPDIKDWCELALRWVQTGRGGDVLTIGYDRLLNAKSMPVTASHLVTDLHLTRFLSNGNE
jgi:hypothetical protein